MLWHAMPPELNTARLMAGAGPAPMLQAAAGWEGLAAALNTQADELATMLASLESAWSGAGSDSAIKATAPMVPWLHNAARQAEQRAMQAARQAAAYTRALGMTPSLPEIASNHITRAVLVATNFFGINMVPIGFKETDYFVRMWNQAAGSMDSYEAETMANTTFEPVEPMKPILAPGLTELAEGATASKIAELMAGTAVPELLAKVEASQLAQRMGKMMGPAQQLAQLIQQTSSTISDNAATSLNSAALDQVGLIGASPLSNHPLAGGSGPSTGTGLMRAASLPGAGGGFPTRTPLLADLLDKTSVTPAGVGAGNAGVRPVGLGGSATGLMGGGVAPLGAMGAAGQSAANTGIIRSAAAVSATITEDDNKKNTLTSFDDEDDDDW